MATFFEAPALHERDLRSAKHEWRRDKTSAQKWSRGTKPSVGVRIDVVTGELLCGSEGQQAKVRPRSKYCDMSHHTKHTTNLVKLRRNWQNSDTLFKTKLHAKLEISEASRYLADLPPVVPLVRRQSVGDNFLYSFDHLDTPGRPYSLESFVKAPTARDTEKLVEKEYEILDTHGEALKGRKARRELRHGHSDPPTETIADDEGFELI